MVVATAAFRVAIVAVTISLECSNSSRLFKTSVGKGGIVQKLYAGMVIKTLQFTFLIRKVKSSLKGNDAQCPFPQNGPKLARRLWQSSMDFSANFRNSSIFLNGFSAVWLHLSRFGTSSLYHSVVPFRMQGARHFRNLCEVNSHPP